MTIPEAVAVAGMRDVDLWRKCQKNALGDYVETPDNLREQALNVLASAWTELEGQTCSNCAANYPDDPRWCTKHAHLCERYGHRCGAWKKREGA